MIKLLLFISCEVFLIGILVYLFSVIKKQKLELLRKDEYIARIEKKYKEACAVETVNYDFCDQLDFDVSKIFQSFLE